jgi:hypothetical protein
MAMKSNNNIGVCRLEWGKSCYCTQVLTYATLLLFVGTGGFDKLTRHRGKGMVKDYGVWRCVASEVTR